MGGNSVPFFLLLVSVCCCVLPFLQVSSACQLQRVLGLMVAPDDREDEDAVPEAVMQVLHHAQLVSSSGEITRAGFQFALQVSCHPR